MIRTFLILLAFIGLVLPAQAQFMPSSSAERPEVSTENLTPELIDGMLGRLTDAEIREVCAQSLFASQKSGWRKKQAPARLN